MNKQDYFLNTVYIPGIGHEDLPSIFCLSLWEHEIPWSEDDFYNAAGFDKETTFVSIVNSEAYFAAYVTKTIRTPPEIDFSSNCKELLNKMLEAGAQLAWIAEEFWAETQIYENTLPISGEIVGYATLDQGPVLCPLDGDEIIGLNHQHLEGFLETKKRLVKL
ncbi:hypothetical protein N8I74_07540 [Chitiniphilus purpureus]|uniref:DUF1851 domain-containing protein n=1 Tax=Chitiniphilus purpureus TaxID=2981137 RepID=A0ABY6DYE1_9NEIS|nr:hypothetical protein [Chitiniphilus sp. CD1]UXY16858.1 hypothetical protein N8I74_07540 [Chitiniphilus sp. CD1]